MAIPQKSIRGTSYSVVNSTTRPADTTAYTAGDVVGTATSGVRQLVGAGRPGGAIQITSCDLTIALTDIPSGMTSFRLHLYMEPPVDILDNAAFTAAAADRTSYRGFVDLTPAVIGSGFLYATADYIGKNLRLTSSSLWGVLVTNGAYTPTSGEALTIIFRSLELG